MSRIIKLFWILISFITLYSCGNGNYKNVTINGTVLNKDSNLPIANATVKVKCWAYSLEKWESGAIEKEVVTDIDGKYSLNFKEGEALDIFIVAKDYKNFETSMTLNKSNVLIKTELEKP